MSVGDIELDSRQVVSACRGARDSPPTLSSASPRPAGRSLRGLVLGALVAAAAWGGWRYWQESRPLPQSAATIDSAPATGTAGRLPAPSTVPTPATSPAPVAQLPATEGPALPPPHAEPPAPAAAAAAVIEPAVAPPAPQPGFLTVAPAWDSAMTLRLGTKTWTLDRERRLELAPGTYRLKFAIATPVYAHAAEMSVRLKEGESRQIVSPIERPGRLTVQPHINARQAFVRLDGALAVATPLRGRWLAPGPHTVEIVAAPDPASPVLRKESVVIRAESESILTFDLDGRSPLRLAEKPILPN